MLSPSCSPPSSSCVRSLPLSSSSFLPSYSHPPPSGMQLTHSLCLSSLSTAPRPPLDPCFGPLSSLFPSLSKTHDLNNAANFGNPPANPPLLLSQRGEPASGPGTHRDSVGCPRGDGGFRMGHLPPRPPQAWPLVDATLWLVLTQSCDHGRHDSRLVSPTTLRGPVALSLVVGG